MLAERARGLAADSAWIRRRLDEVAALEDDIAEPYNRGEVALARSRRALLAGMSAYALDASRIARNLFEKTGVDRRVGDAAMTGAHALATLGRPGPAIAETLRARDAYRREREHWSTPEALERWTEATTQLAQLLARVGRSADALAELRAASAVVGVSAPGRARIALAKARILAARSQYEPAERLLRGLAADDDDVLNAEIIGTRGVIRVQAGRPDDGAAELQLADEGFRNALAAVELRAGARLRGPTDDDLALADRIRVGVAVCEMNLGAIHGAAGDHRAALSRYRAALTMLDAVPLAAERVADCRLNIGVEAMACGDLPGADREFSAVNSFLTAQPTPGALHAGCLLNTGRLRDLQGRHEEARDHYHRARRAFLGLGLVEWAARCGLNTATSLARDGADGALEELIPAITVLDRMRFQFPTAGARLAWRQTITGAAQLAFRLADGDPRLLAELIETTINSGVHSARAVLPSTVGSEVELHDRLQSPGTPLPGTPSATAAADPAEGARALIAGAVLPMHPPPPLRLPTGAVALERFLSLATDVYGGYATSAETTPSPDGSRR